MVSDKANEQLRKVFVGGLNKDLTSEESLKNYFSTWGTVIDCAVMRDSTKRSRGFGFILFDDPDCVDQLMKEKRDSNGFHVDGNQIEVKRALPRTERGVGGGSSFSSKSGRDSRWGTRKIFIGGLASSTTSDDIADYFGKFGKLEDIELLRDRQTGNLRGFGFITFEDEDVADKVCAMREHSIKLKLCEVKKAESRSTMMRNRQDREPYRGDGDRDYGRFNRDGNMGYNRDSQGYPGSILGQGRSPGYNMGGDRGLGGSLGGAANGLAALQALGSLLQPQQPQAPPPMQGNANLDLNSLVNLLRNVGGNGGNAQGQSLQNQLSGGLQGQGGGGFQAAPAPSNLGGNLGALGANVGGNQNPASGGANQLLGALGNSGLQGLSQLINLANLAGLNGGGNQQGSQASGGQSTDTAGTGYGQGRQASSATGFQDTTQATADYSTGYGNSTSTSNVQYPSYDDTTYNSVYNQASSNFGPAKSSATKTSQSPSSRGAYRPY